MASMNDSATKTVAESAEKKNRDVQSLDTALLPMVRELETLDNKLLVSIGLADAAEKNSLTSYPDRFDIASVTDLLDEIQDLKEVPFATESLQRSIDH